MEQNISEKKNCLLDSYYTIGIGNAIRLENPAKLTPGRRSYLAWSVPGL